MIVDSGGLLWLLLFRWVANGRTLQDTLKSDWEPGERRKRKVLAFAVGFSLPHPVRCVYASLSRPMSDSEDEIDVDEVLKGIQTKLNLSDAYVDYLKPTVEDLCDLDDESCQKELQKLETQIANLEYTIISKIGSGAFGSVYRGKRKRDNQIVAIKIIDLEDSKEDIGNITREIGALVNGKSCAQLTAYYGSVVVGTKLWIAMEYLDGGSVLDKVKVKPLTEAQIAVVAKEVLLGLRYLAGEKKLHRDIKAANILLSSTGQVKLADFGASGQLTESMTKCNTFVGSPYWMAPEILTENKYDGKADVWSLGITCLEMLSGKPPLSEFAPLQVITMIPNRDPPLPDRSKYSSSFCDFVAACLTKDPKKRPTLSELLKMPFITEAGPASILSDAGAGAGTG